MWTDSSKAIYGLECLKRSLADYFACTDYIDYKVVSVTTVSVSIYRIIMKWIVPSDYVSIDIYRLNVCCIDVSVSIT